MRQRLLKGNHLYAGTGGFRNLTFANIQRDVAYGRGAEGADPKRCDARAEENSRSPERRSLSAISRSPLPAIEL